jgi:hypothetical protein
MSFDEELLLLVAKLHVCPSSGNVHLGHAADFGLLVLPTPLFVLI